MHLFSFKKNKGLEIESAVNATSIVHILVTDIIKPRYLTSGPICRDQVGFSCGSVSALPRSTIHSFPSSLTPMFGEVGGTMLQL